jgi:hypothetical protein
MSLACGGSPATGSGRLAADDTGPGEVFGDDDAFVQLSAHPGFQGGDLQGEVFVEGAVGDPGGCPVGVDGGTGEGGQVGEKAGGPVPATCPAPADRTAQQVDGGARQRNGSRE